MKYTGIRRFGRIFTIERVKVRTYLFTMVNLNLSI
jgi:hypothetical protein